MPASHKDATGAALLSRVLYWWNGTNAVPADATTPLPVAGVASVGGTFGTTGFNLLGRDANSVTARAVRVGVFGDLYNEGGSATSRLMSAANTTNATVVKASAGKVFTITGYNAAAALRYLKLYNKATAPTVGTDTPVFTFACKATDVFNIQIPNGYQFGTGIGFALTTGAADSDTGALTAGDITCLHINYT